MPDGDSNKQTQASSSEPWPAAQPLLKQGLADASGIYKSTAFNPYPGSTVVPFSGQTTQSMQDQTSYANALKPNFGAAFDAVAGNVYNGGLNDTQRGVVNRLTGQATQAFNPNDNPGFQSVLKQATDSAGQAVDMGASAAGRYGSGIHQGNVAREVGNVAGQLTSNAYNDFQNRRDAANTSLFNAGQQQYNNINSAPDALGSAYQSLLMPSQTLAGVGAQNEDLAGRQMNDQLRQWQGTNDAKKNALEWLMAIGSGAGSLGGSSNTTAQGPKPNPFGQVVGGLLGANSLFG